MNWQKWIGAAACIILIVSTYMHWAYYPDLDKFFTGFDSKVYYRGRWLNYYGRPGIFLTFFGFCCAVFHLVPRNWAKRANLVIAALCLAYAFRCYINYSAAYSGVVPHKQAGLFLMFGAAMINLLMAVLARAVPAKAS